MNEPKIPDAIIPTDKELLTHLDAFRFEANSDNVLVIKSSDMEQTSELLKEVAEEYYGKSWYRYNPIFFSINTIRQFQETLFNIRNPGAFNILKISDKIATQVSEILATADMNKGFITFSDNDSIFDFSRYGANQEDVSEFRYDPVKFIQASEEFGFPIYRDDFTSTQQLSAQNLGVDMASLNYSADYYASVYAVPQRLRVLSKVIIIGNI